MSAFIGGPPAPRIIQVTNSFTALTGGTSDTILGYANIPGNLLGLTGYIDVDASFKVTGSAGTWVYNLRIVTGSPAGTLAGTNLMGLTVSAGNNVRLKTKIANFNSLSAQRTGSFNGSFANSTNGYASSTIDTSAAFTVSINAALGNAADSLELMYASVVLVPSIP